MILDPIANPITNATAINYRHASIYVKDACDAVVKRILITSLINRHHDRPKTIVDVILFVDYLSFDILEDKLRSIPSLEYGDGLTTIFDIENKPVTLVRD